MNAKDKVSDIMTKQVKTLCINDSLFKAEVLFKKHKIHHLPVVENNEIVGILSWNDLLRLSFADAVTVNGKSEEDMYSIFTLEKVMTSDVQTIPSKTNIETASKLFVKKKFHALPVIQDDKLVGILTTTDIIKYFLKKKCG